MSFSDRMSAVTRSIQKLCLRITALTALSSMSALALAEQCTAVYPDGLQSNRSGGVVRFEFASQLLNNPDNILASNRVEHWWYGFWNRSCDGEYCQAGGTAAKPFYDVSFPAQTGTRNVYLQRYGYKELDASEAAVNQLYVGTGATLKLKNNSDHSGNYRVRYLEVREGGRIVLAPGDYWIGRMRLSDNIKVEVEGEGTARIFVEDSVYLPWRSQWNTPSAWQSGDASKLLLYTRGNLYTSSSVQVSGMLYAKGIAVMGVSSYLAGAVSAKHVVMRPFAIAEYQPTALLETNFNNLCGEVSGDIDGDQIPDEIDGDIDGDGVSNQLETLAGTDPENATSVPVDANLNGTPDVLEQQQNACVAAFPDGMQSHSNNGEIYFGVDAQLKGAKSFGLFAQRLSQQRYSNQLGCDSHLCFANTYAAPTLDVPAFPQQQSSLRVNIRRGGERTLGDDGNSDFHKIKVQRWATLTFSPAQSEYRIGELKLDSRARLRLAPGDYYIDKLTLRRETQVEVVGEGSVRIYVARDLHIGRESLLNAPEYGQSGDASKLLIFTKGRLRIESDTTVSGLLYSQRSAELYRDVTVFGALSASDIELNSGARIVHQPEAVTGLDFASLCDIDGDGVYDGRDEDLDGDGISNEYEEQAGTDPYDPASTPPDQDGDGIPDNVDNDRDGDGYNNDQDAFPSDPNEWSDLDGDGIGDNSDADRDGDGFSNELEIQLGTDPDDAASFPQDLDGDGIPDGQDDDIDGDGVLNADDAFPEDATESSDLDGDGIGDNSDPDRDGDGFSNAQEIAVGTNPNDPASRPNDLDNDGIPDELDNDRDGDGVPNDADAFPDDATETSDLDGDGIGDNSDLDRDGDGISNDYETAAGTDPDDAASTPPDQDGDGIPDSLDEDRDGDGVNNSADAFPDDASESSDLDGDGIGDNSDPDRDGDGFDNSEEDTRGTNPDDASDYPDTVAPELTILNPDGQQVDADSVQITGQVSDPQQPYSGVATVVLTSENFPDVAFQGFITGQQFTAEVPLGVQLNRLTAVATDLSGNSTQASVNIRRISPPQFVSVAPQSGTVLATDTVTVSGRVYTLLPLTEVQFYLNEWQITPDGTGETGYYSFNLPNIPLDLGQNDFELRVVAEEFEDSRSLQLSYLPEDAAQLSEPDITILSPSAGTVLNQDSFTLTASVLSYAGPASIQLDTEPQTVTAFPRGDNQVQYQLSRTVSFAPGADQVSFTLTATDSLGKQTTKQVHYSRDLQQPEIVLSATLSPEPAVNPVAASPYILSGTVSDNNLAAFSVNGESVGVLPTAQEGVYQFAAPVAISAGQETTVTLEATDFSGNRSQQSYVLTALSSQSLTPLLPVAGSVLSGTGEPLNLQLAARLAGLQGGEKVIAWLDDQQSVAVELTLSDTLASGNISLPGNSAEHQIHLALLNAADQPLATTQIAVTVNNPDDLALELTRMEPQNGAGAVEPNAAIELYFNKTVDLQKLQLEVRETLNGYTYVNQDAPGQDFLSAKGASLQEVHRTREAVNGTLDLLPGDKTVAFYAGRQFGFGANIFVDVIYDGEEVGRGQFNIRPLPTFVQGAVTDQFGQPVAGIRVSIPELQRSTHTNGDGGYAFGYQEAASDVIPAGNYRLEINPDQQQASFGSQVLNISLQQGRMNNLGLTRLQELNPQVNYQQVSGGRLVSLAENELQLDLSNASLLFSDQRRSGPLHSQFLTFDQLTAHVMPGAVPMWIFAQQPRGVEVSGNVEISIRMPKLRNSYSYIPEDMRYVVLLGFNPQSEVIEPVGVGEIENYIVKSAVPPAYQNLDYIGYAMVDIKYQESLQAVAEGTKSLLQLKAELRQ